MEGKKGFTLIELLVVIAIIAILAAILFPIFNTAMTHSKKARCLANLKQIGTGIDLYCADYDDRLPWADCFAKGWRDVGWSSGKCLHEWDATGREIGVIGSYVKNKAVWFCPVRTGKSIICENAGIKITAEQNQTTYIWTPWTYNIATAKYGKQLFGMRRGDIPKVSKQMIMHETPYAEPGAHNHVTMVAFADGHAGSFNTRDCLYFGPNGHGDVWTAHSEDGWYTPKP